MARAPPQKKYYLEKGDGKIVQSIIPWIGGKQALCKAIISRFPADYRQRTYVEVFGGGASVLLNKEKSAKEIYNDFNSSLVNLFRMVRERPEELKAKLRYILNSREDFDTVKAIRNSKSKLRATANVNIAGAFAVQGFRVFDSKNGLFVKEPEQNYVKEGTELTRSVFFPITKEAREALYGQILHSYEMVMEKEMGQRQDDLDYLFSDEDAPPEREYEPPVEDEDLPFDFGQSM